MAHSFALAQFNPTITASKAQMDPGVAQAASSITCHPFLALTIALDESHTGKQYGYDVVSYPVSPNKPTGEFAKYYTTVTLPPTKQTKLLHLGLPSQTDVLYIQTVPALYLKCDLPSNVLPFQLDPESLEQLRTQGRGHQESWLGTGMQHRKSGGEEPVQKDWDSWSGDNLYEVHGHSGPFVVEFLDPSGIDLEAITAPRVVEELMTFKKLAMDYSRSGVQDLIAWCREARNFKKLPSTVDVSGCRAQQLHLDGEIKDQTIALHQMRIPVDRQPIPHDDEPESENSVDPIAYMAVGYPPTPLSNIRVVLFDSIGSIFDRQTPVLRALRSLDPQVVNTFDQDDVLRVYFEAESILLQDNPEWDLHRVVEGALKASLHRLGTLNRCDPVLLTQAREGVLRLGLYPGVEKTVDELCSAGFTVIGLSVPDSSSFVLPPLPQSFIVDSFSQDRHALVETSPDLFSTLIERLRSIRTDLEGKEQVLVVTTGRFRVLENARRSSYPTALVQHNLESRVDLYPTCSPTLVIPGGLNSLKEKIMTFAADPTDEDPDVDVFAVRAVLYQGVELLGSGSFGEVRGGVHVLTGAPVAIKYDTPESNVKPHVCETNKYPCSLPYEAQAYRVLAGGPGIPSLRWYGMKDGAHILVLDKLGPDLDAVRRLCRGRLSLKTVLMLGLQMLERVAFVHSRGLILRDLKPHNFVMGLGEGSSRVYLLDFGLVMPYVNPITNEHIPFVENLERIGTARYTSYNMLLKRETSRRDDVEALGNVLLYLLRGRLPWQGIYAPSVEAKYVRLGEMRVGKAMQDFVDESPGKDVWHTWFTHCRELGFVDKPDYGFLRDVMTRQIEADGGVVDWKFDWLDGTQLEYGTLVPGEYKLEASLFYDEFSAGDLIPLACQY